MYVWARMLKTALAAHYGKQMEEGATATTIVGRIWPQDLDTNFHVNNGRYLTLMDLGRSDFMYRSGIGPASVKNRWRPMLTGLSARYRHSLGPFQKYRMETELVGWTERSLFMEHRVIPLSGPHKDGVAVEAVVRAVVLRRDNTKVPASELLAGLSLPAESPPLPQSCAGLLSPRERASLEG